jgi:phosphate:Na+ symporter
MQDSDDIAMLLSKAKLHVKKYDMITNGTADDLIRKGLITNQMAISLMNDSTYAYEISKNLIDMAQEMFMNKNDQKEHLIMDDDDINEIVSA